MTRPAFGAVADDDRSMMLAQDKIRAILGDQAWDWWLAICERAAQIEAMRR